MRRRASAAALLVPLRVAFLVACDGGECRILARRPAPAADGG